MGICVLGPPQVDGGGALAPRDRTVLGVLAVRRGKVVMPDQVADAVWGERPPASWPTQVQICVARLRKVLGAASIETVGGGYRLTLVGDDIDVDRFERLVAAGRTLAATGEPERAAATLAKALGLWRGDPFEDVSGWEPAGSEAARLVEMRRSVEEELADARLAAGDQREVAAAAEGLVAAEPLRERRWVILALAQYRCGRQGDALRTVGRARRYLREQLGIDPGPELTGLEAAILRQDEALVAPTAAPATISAECPYKGLASYDVDDAEVFFGRDAEVAACLDRLRASPLLLLAGPSGCGKSSLVRAGLIPALSRQGRSVVVFVPGNDPASAMTEALAAVDDTPVVVVDQFEELFAVGADPDGVTALCQRLTEHADHRAPVVVCVRADHLAGLSVDSGFARLAEQGLHLVTPLTGDRLREAIEQPAARAGLRLEPGLVDLLVRDCEGEPGALPLLSHALAETWRRRDGHVLTVEGYRASGGIRGAVARSADRLYDNLPADQRAMLRSILLRLVTPSVDGEPVRCRVAMRSLLGDDRREHVVSLLVRTRLVTADAETVELAHEALARAWPRLQSWLDEDAAGVRVLRHLATAAAGWENLGRADGELYRGARLETCLEWRAATRPDLTAVEAAFLAASVAHADTERASIEARARRDARQNRRLRGTLVGVALLAVASLIAGSIAYRQGQRAAANATEADGQRQQAEAQRRAADLNALVSASVALRGSRLDLAALLAVEAHRQAPSAATESALLGLFTTAPGIGRTVQLEGGGPQSTPQWLPNGGGIVVAGPSTVLRVVDPDTGRVLFRLGEPVEDATIWLSASRDGRYIASVITGIERDVQQSSLAVWDLATRQKRFADVTLPIDAGAVAINADGSQIAVAGGTEARILVYDGASGALEREIQPVPRPARSVYNTNTVAVTYAPDGRLVVTSQAGPIRFIDADTGDEVGRTLGPEQTSEGDVSVSVDGRSMITEGFAGAMRYELPSGEPLWDELVRCEEVSEPIEQIDAVLCLDAGRLVALDLATGTPLGPRFDANGGALPLLSPDGTRLWVVSDSGAMTSWQVDGGGLISRLVPRDDHAFVTEYSPDGESFMVNTMTTLPNREPPDRAFVYTGSAVEIVDARTGDLRDRIEGAVLAHFGGDSRFVIARFDDGTIGRYDLTRHERVGAAVDVGFAIEDFTVDGDRLWVWSEFGLFEGHIASVDLATGVVTPLIEAETGLARLYAPSSRALYTVADGDVLQRRDPSSGEPTGELTGVIDMVAGGRVIVAQIDRDVVTIDPETLTADAERFTSDAGAYLDSMDLSGDAARLLVVGVDRRVRLYDVAARTQLGTDISPEVAADAFAYVGPPWTRAAALRDDGRAAAITTDDGIVIWNLDPDRWSEAACELASRNLTRAEWDAYVGDLLPYRATCAQFTTGG